MSSLQGYGTSVGITGGLTVPGENAVAVTPSDSTVLATTRFLYIGGGAPGNLVVDMVGGQTDVTFATVPVGTLLPLRVTKVKAATTCSDVIAIW